MTHLPGYEEMFLNKWYVNGGTSGASPVCVDVRDKWPTEKIVFMDIFGWVLYNNNLIMEEPIMLN
jgi:hypothetical protein